MTGVVLQSISISLTKCGGVVDVECTCCSLSIELQGLSNRSAFEVFPDCGDTFSLIRFDGPSSGDFPSLSSESLSWLVYFPMDCLDKALCFEPDGALHRGLVGVLNCGLVVALNHGPVSGSPLEVSSDCSSGFSLIKFGGSMSWNFSPMSCHSALAS